MEWVNFHHLLYFWVVARTGSIVKASEELMLAEPTISSQIKSLERFLGAKLFEREGRGLKLTEVGQTTFEYADEIFAIGREMLDTVRQRKERNALRFRVGISDVIPKLVAQRLLAPSLADGTDLRLVCREDTADNLADDLAAYTLDLVLSDAPLPSNSPIRGYSHCLADCGVSFLGTESFRPTESNPFPGCLNGMRLITPAVDSTLRRQLDQWFERLGVTPRIVGEFEDSALMKVYAQSGLGICPAPTLIEDEIRKFYGVEVIGRTEDIRERFYAITVDRKFPHPAVEAIRNASITPSV